MSNKEVKKTERVAPVAKPKTKTKKTSSKKIWRTVLAPRLFDNVEIGEIPLHDVADAIGRIVSVSMMTLTGDPKKTPFTVSFKITGQKGDQLITEVIGVQMNSSMVRKSMRRGKAKIESSFEITTKDGKVVRVKPLCITRFRAKGGVASTLRNLLKTKLATKISKVKYEPLMYDIFSNKLQKEVQDELNKIYPLQSIAIRWIQLLEGSGTSEDDPEVVVEETVVKEAPVESPAEESA